MSVSVAVMAHPSREAFIPELLEALDRPAEVVWDQINNRWDTGRRSMLAFDPSASHHLVVQDDAVVCRDLVAGVERLLPTVPPESPVGLYVGTVRPWPSAVRRLVQATREDTSWLRMAQLNWGVAVVMPTCHIEEMIEWCDTQDVPNYDKRMSRWFERKAIPVWYSWPSLVEHRDSPSLVPGRTSKRHAHRFIGADVSALTQRIDGGVMDMPALQRGGEMHTSRRRVPTRTWERVSDGHRRIVHVGSDHDRRLESLDGWEEVGHASSIQAGQAR